MNKDYTCAHERCMCAVEGENDFCSDKCRDAADHKSAGQKCTCGHKDCM